MEVHTMTDEQAFELQKSVVSKMETLKHSNEYIRDFVLVSAQSVMHKPELYNKYIALAEKYS